MNPKIMLILIGIILVSSIFISGCGSITVSEVNANKEKYLGEEIVVTGIVSSTFKLGTLSGYILKDEKTDDKLYVNSKSLPEEGKKMNVKGTLMKDLVFYYLLAK